VESKIFLQNEIGKSLQAAYELGGDHLSRAGGASMGRALAMAKATPASWLWQQGSWNTPAGFS